MKSDGSIVSHPNKDFELKKNFLKNPEPGYEDYTVMTENALTRNPGFNWVKGENGGKDLVCYAPVDETPWIFAFTVESSQVNVAGDVLRIMMIITSSIVCVVILVVLGLISAKALKPLRKLKVSINDFASGKANLTNRIEINSQNEICSTAAASIPVCPTISGLAKLQIITS